LADFSSTYAGTIDIPQNSNLTYYYTRSDRYRDWIYAMTDTSGGTWIPKSFLQTNTNTAIMNYNRLGGRDFDPSGVFLGYMFSDISNVMQTFYAQKTIMSNMENDICTSKKNWTLCSRSSIFDQLYNLAFASTDFNNSCLKICCGRSWTELIDALREYSHFSYLLAGNNIISFDYLPADPSSNRFPENLFSILGTNITRIQNYPITVPPTYDASYISGNWTYQSTNGGTNQWEVLVNTSYQVTVTFNTPFFFNLIVPGTDITLYINVKICNSHCNILSNKIRIAYVCRVDKSLNNYCGSGHREEIQYASAAAAAAAQAAAVAPATLSISGTAQEDETLTAVFSPGGGGIKGTQTYEWKNTTGTIVGETSSTYTLQQTDVGKTLTVVLNWTNQSGQAKTITSVATSTVLNVNDPPVGTVTISGTLNKGDTLTVTNNLTDEDGMPLVVTYDWIRNGGYGSPIFTGNTSNNTYTLVDADVGTTINVRATYTDALGNTHDVTSVTTNTITNTTNVTISGTPTQKQTLTATFNVGTAQVNGGESYQWKRDGAAITNGNGNTYALVQADVGTAITVTVSWVDNNNDPHNVTSTATNAVENVNDTPTGSISINGNTWLGQVLTANLSTLVDEDGLPATFQYKWLRDGADIASATSSSYTLVQADVGFPISVNITYTDNFGQVESVTSTQTANITEGPADPGFAVSPSINSKDTWTFKNDDELIIPSDGQQYTLIPNMDFTIRVIMWGGGGGKAHYSSGSSGIGAAGGYTDGIIAFESGKTYYAFAATHGGGSSSSSQGGGGGLPGGGNGHRGGGEAGGGGGGYSAIFLTTYDQAGALLIAGGGGGATGYRTNAGEGGGLKGGNGDSGSTGGTQTAGGNGKVKGTELQGGGAATTSTTGESSGGGGGYWGGGSGPNGDARTGSGGSGFISSTANDGMTIRGRDQYAPGSPSLPNSKASNAPRADSFDTEGGYGPADAHPVDTNRGIWDLENVYNFYKQKLNDPAGAIAQGGREGNVSQDAADGMLILKKPNAKAYRYYRLYFVYNDVKSNGTNLMDTAFGSTTNYIRFVRKGDNKLLPFDENGAVMNVDTEGTVTSHPTNYTHTEAGNKQGNYTYSLHQIFKQELTSQTIWNNTWGSGGKSPGKDADPQYTWIQYKFNTAEIIDGVWFGSQRPGFQTKYSFHNISLLATDNPAIGDKGPDAPVVLSEWDTIIPYTQITWDNQSTSVGEKKYFVAGELQRGITTSS
jgi:hypothetical protein